MAQTKKKPASPATKSPAAESATDVLTVSDETLAETPARALKLLGGIGTTDGIRIALAGRGYSDADHEDGWKLLHATSGYKPGATTKGEHDAKVRAAISEIDAWDEPGMRIIDVTLRRRFPKQHAFLMNGLAPQQGAAAVPGVKLVLERLNALEGDPKRKATAADDKAAVELLARRGITAEERSKLAGLVTIAESFAAPNKAGELAEKQAAEARHDALVALRHWYEEWAEIARLVVKRRDWLIRLGLAERKLKKDPTA